MDYQDATVGFWLCCMSLVAAPTLYIVCCQVYHAHVRVICYSGFRSSVCAQASEFHLTVWVATPDPAGESALSAGKANACITEAVAFRPAKPGLPKRSCRMGGIATAKPSCLHATHGQHCCSWQQCQHSIHASRQAQANNCTAHAICWCNSAAGAAAAPAATAAAASSASRNGHSSLDAAGQWTAAATAPAAV
jgi:hypothetical protein